MPPTRRTVLKYAGWTALSWSRIAGANERPRIATLGTGGRAQYLLRQLKEHAQVDIVGLCDVWPARLEKAQQELAPAAETTKDFRALLSRADVDGVIIGSPDHWHVPMAVEAVDAGKDVYLEKPVTHTVAEGATLVEAVRRSKRIVQAGYQQRSFPHMQEARELIRSALLGPVTLVETWWNQNYLAADKPKVEAADIDWDQFLGSSTPRAFDPWRCTEWRFYWDYGGGTITDLFSHWIDTIHWILEDAQPVAAAGIGRKNHVLHWECPDTVSASLTYSKGHVVSYTSAMVTRLLDGGLVFRGPQASLRLTRDGYEVYSDKSSLEQHTHLPKPDRTAQAKRDGTIDHLLNWLECMQSRAAPRADVASAVAAANAAHYTNRALRSVRTLSLPPRDSGWRRLFDGRTFKGWIGDTAEIWTVRENAIVGRGVNLKHGEVIRTEELFNHFELRLQVRLSAGNGNAGIRFRSYPTADPNEFSGYRVEVGEKFWGSLYDEARRNAHLARSTEEALAGIDILDWHEFVIRAEGRHIEVMLNGMRVVDYEEDSPGLMQRGFVGLEVGRGTATLAQFRDIEVRELY